MYTASMKKSSSSGSSKRVILTLPKPLAAELAKYARLLRGGDKSGFVADALRSYIDQFHRRRHVALVRESYAAAANHARALAREWAPLDDETWARLDELAAKSRKRS
jgi:metal-responsive CopG/Arc/MetJ family transcriptional regulator